MFDLSVVAIDGIWVLVDETEGELGAYDSKAAALKAAGDFGIADQEPRHVLIQDDVGDWEETVVAPPSVH